MLGGDTFGIHDDDAYYCHAGAPDRFCPGAGAPGYADHTVRTPSLGQQLEAKGLTWRGYYEDLPASGSLAVIADNPGYIDPTMTLSPYSAHPRESGGPGFFVFGKPGKAVPVQG